MELNYKLSKEQIEQLRDPKHTVTLDSVIKFGLYAGHKTYKAIEEDLEYMKWFIKNYIHPIDKTVIDYVNEKLAEQTNKQ